VRRYTDQLESRIAQLEAFLDDSQAEIQKRDARIAELEAQLAACAAGPWRKPTEEDVHVLMRVCKKTQLSDDPSLLPIFDSSGYAKCVATINPPEAE
jgi:Tfp pilus assembly protein FimV